MRPSVLPLLAALVVGLVGFVGCGGSTSTTTAAPSGSTAASETTEMSSQTATGEAPTEIRIGMSTPLSGDAAPWGIGQLRGLELIADKYNAEGGIFIKEAGAKIPIKVIAYDDKYTPSETAVAAKRLISQDHVDFIGNMGEEMATTVAPMAQEAGIIQWGTSWELTDPNPDFPLSFSSLLRNQEIMGSGLAWFHESYPAVTKIGSIAINNAGGQMEHKILEAAAKDLGMEVVFWDTFDWGATDFSPILLKAVQAEVEVLVYSSAPPDSVGNIVKQGKDLGYTGYHLGFSSDIAVISEIAGKENTEGMVISGAELGEPIPEAAQAYADAYVAKYGPPLSASTLIPWLQSWEPLVEAIERAQSLDPQTVAAELHKGKFPTIGGDVWFGGKEFYGIDNQMLGPIPMSIAKDGKPVLAGWAQPAPYPAEKPQ